MCLEEVCLSQVRLAEVYPGEVLRLERTAREVPGVFLGRCPAIDSRHPRLAAAVRDVPRSPSITLRFLPQLEQPIRRYLALGLVANLSQSLLLSMSLVPLALGENPSASVMI